MPKNLLHPNRRSMLLGVGGLFAVGTLGVMARNQIDTTAIAAIPVGWYLISRYGPGDRERQLIAWHNHSLVQHVLETEVGTNFLNAVLSPDGRLLAVLKRVTRGSMPTDAVALYDSKTFARIAVVEVQIAFQRTPTFSMSWSADAQQIAVSYDMSGRTLLFRVSQAGEVSLKAMLDQGSFRYHPTRADLAIHTTPTLPNQLSIVQRVGDIPEQQLATITGTDAQWSPDGANIAYQDDLGAQGGQRLIIRNETTKQLSVMPIQVRAKAWSPNGQRLAVYCLASNDQLKLGKFVPANLIPGWRPGTLEPRLFIYDTQTGHTRTISNLRLGFQLAHLQWLHPDWLLVGDVQAKQSFLTDRRADQRITITMMDNFTPLLRWLPQV